MLPSVEDDLLRVRSMDDEVEPDLQEVSSPSCPVTTIDRASVSLGHCV